MRIDPTGLLDGDYYDRQGNYLGNDGIDDGKVYTVSGDSKFSIGDFQEGGKYFNNQTGFAETNGAGYSVNELGVKHSELLKMAAVTYGEASQLNDTKEMFAIASTIQNNRNGRSLSKTLSGNYSYAIGKGKYNQFMKGGYSKSGGMKTSLAAAINAVTGGTDYSNGATFWDGIDVLSGGSSHYRQRKAAYDSRKGIYDPNGHRNTYYINAQEYCCKVYGVNGKTYRTINPLITVPTSEGALWRVTGTQGGSIFYNEIK